MNLGSNKVKITLFWEFSKNPKIARPFSEMGLNGPRHKKGGRFLDFLKILKIMLFLLYKNPNAYFKGVARLI